jgi:hypothetical protein
MATEDREFSWFSMRSASCGEPAPSKRCYDSSNEQGSMRLPGMTFHRTKVRMNRSTTRFYAGHGKMQLRTNECSTPESETLGS